MPKYYIKINKEKHIVSDNNFHSAILNIVNKNKNNYKSGTTVYISETGFESTQSWSCFKIDKYLENKE